MNQFSAWTPSDFDADAPRNIFTNPQNDDVEELLAPELDEPISGDTADATALDIWRMANQEYLMAALTVLRVTLRFHDQTTLEAEAQRSAALRDLHDLAHAMPQPAALETLCAIFHLSPFERAVLLLCAGHELDNSFAALYASSDGSHPSSPTFALALSRLPDPHWNALNPAGPLRHWRLIEVGAGSTLTHSPLRIDERILHYLTGVSVLDERLASLVHLIAPSDVLIPSQWAQAERLATHWTAERNAVSLPAVQLCGDDKAAKRSVAATACARLGLILWAMPARALPVEYGDLETLMRLWERELALSEMALLLDCDDVEPSDGPRNQAISRMIEGMRGPLIMSSRHRRNDGERPTIVLEIAGLTADERRTLWSRVLGPMAPRMHKEIETLVGQFHLGASAIQTAGTEAMRQFTLSHHNQTIDDLAQVVWDCCRLHARPRLDALAQRIEPAATWDDLVLPEAQMQILTEIAVHLRQRTTVYEEWGFASRGIRGLGITALFVGASGTGKTMAAEVLATRLRLDIYRIDLSAVVSKYIGETEKNLRQVFDAADEGGAILLFDEADALFGKRSEVKDSHDRYANIEVSYLLQRMEAYRGLAILTTNMKEALDPAFLRRIRFVVEFPFPDADQRMDIWRRIFPPATPTENLDMPKLARLHIAGGNIRNIALNAAFLAADAGEPVRMTHLLRAARSEYAKLQKPLGEAEIRGWV